ncbi:hypothetical protein AK812_SmicGene48674, partial [Symbiodinium microadriaticum]
MVSWSALETTLTDNAMCRRIWEQLWQSQQAVSWSAGLLQMECSGSPTMAYIPGNTATP